MASISIIAGNLTSTRTVDNATFLLMASSFVKASGGPVNGTNQEKLDWCLTVLAHSFRDTAKVGKRQQIAEDAAATAGVDSWDLT